MEHYTLRNGYSLPTMCIGLNRMDAQTMLSVVRGAMDSGIKFFDTARDYGNEPVVGKVLQKVISERGLCREDIFITTKIGNGQQTTGNLWAEIDKSLRNLRTDYVDVWLLHWPVPQYYIDSYSQMLKIMESGKVRSIGMANVQIRHLHQLQSVTGTLPHIVQIEHHPFRTEVDFLAFCRTNFIQVAAYSPLCFMIPKLKNNPCLQEIASRYGKTIGQVVLRWHLQHNVIPVFRSTNPLRFKENTDILDFTLSEEDMNKIFLLNENFKFIPESLHCPGY